MIGTDWMESTPCVGKGELFYAPYGRGSETPDERQRREAAAKSICELCPVREICLEHALKYREDDGIWGGQTEKQRNRILRNRRLRR